jgi:hypothetical protein
MCPGSGREGQYINLAAPRGVATQVSGVWFDRVTFYGERYDTYRSNWTGNSVTIANGGSGFNISVAGVILPSDHPRRASDGYHESWTSLVYDQSTFTTFGYHHGQNANKVRITNSTFNGFGFQINWQGDNLTVAQNRFTAHPLDVVRMSSPAAGTFEWNVIDGHRTPTAEEAVPLGFGSGNKPPHGDTIQTLGDDRGLWYRYNYMNDTSGHLHFIYMNSGAGGGDQRDAVVNNNESRQSHEHGTIISAINGLEYNFNKCTRVSGNKTIYINIGGNGNDTSNTNCTNNIAGKFLGNGNHISGGQDGNVVENLSDTLYKTGFVQIRQEKVANGARYAGIGGNVNNVAWTDRS